MAAGLHKSVLLGNLAEKKPSLESSPPPPSGYVPANDCVNVTSDRHVEV